MDDIEDDARYPQNPYGENNQQSYVSNRHKLPVGNVTYSRPVDNQYAVGVDEDSDNEEEGEHELGEEAGENIQTNGIHYAGKDVDVDVLFFGYGWLWLCVFLGCGCRRAVLWQWQWQ